jgi:hypothetical protein
MPLYTAEEKEMLRIVDPQLRDIMLLNVMFLISFYRAFLR